MSTIPTDSTNPSAPTDSAAPSRRAFLRGVGIAGAATAAAVGASACAEEGEAGGVDKPAAAWPETTVAFDGEHQAGIATPQQSFCKLIAFTIKDNKQTREDVVRLMRLWTDDARRMCGGRAGLADLCLLYTSDAADE